MKKLAIAATVLLLAAVSQRASAYIDLAPTLAKVSTDARRISVIELTEVDLEKRTAKFKEATAIKGALPETVTGTLYLFENKSIPAQLSQWAQNGQRGVLLINGNLAILSIGHEWYSARASTTAGELNGWKLNAVRPDLPLSYYGSVSHLIEAMTAMQAGKDAVISVVAYGADNEGASFDLALNRPNLPGMVRVQRIRARLNMPNMVMAASANPAYFVGEGRASAADIPKLIEALKSTDVATRQESAEDLGWLGKKATAAAPALETLLADNTPAVRFAAARAILRIKGKNESALKVLAEGLTSKDPSQRGEAARLTGLSGDAVASLAPKLIPLLKEENRTVKYFALQAVSTLGRSASTAADAVIPLLDDAEFSMDAADALGRIGSSASAALPKLAKMLESTDVAVRWAAVRGMSQIGGDDSKPAADHMAKLLSAEFSEVDGYNMMIYLALMGPAAKSAIPAIQNARIKNPVLQTATTWAIQPDQGFPWIFTGNFAGGFRGPMMLGNGDGPDFAKYIYENYVHELGPRLRGSAKLLATKIVDNTAGNIPEWGYKILSSSPEAAEDVLAILSPLLENEQPLMRERAAVALGYMGPAALAAKSKVESAIVKAGTNEREKRLIQWCLREIQKPAED